MNSSPDVPSFASDSRACRAEMLFAYTTRLHDKQILAGGSATTADILKAFMSSGLNLPRPCSESGCSCGVVDVGHETNRVATEAEKLLSGLCLGSVHAGGRVEACSIGHKRARS